MADFISSPPQHRSSFPQQQEVILSQAVEELIARICQEQNQQPLGTPAKQRLAALGEENAINLLNEIAEVKIRKNFNAIIFFKTRSSFPGSPTNDRFSPSPKRHQQNRCSPNITPTRLMMDAQSKSRVVFPIPMQLEQCSTSEEPSAQLIALGELEFRKAFIILSYLGGNKLETFFSEEKIRALKELQMRTFEIDVWKTVGCKCGYVNEPDRVKSLDWDSRSAHIYHCHVHRDGSIRFKGPYFSNSRNFLQNALGDDNILMVKFEEEVPDERSSARSSYHYYATYEEILRKGILVGLRCYRFFVYKDGGKEEKKKDPTSSGVKCFFVRMESKASSDATDYVLSGKTVREGRSIFMHIDTTKSLPSYMARFSLVLSKTLHMDIDLSCVNIRKIDDIFCQDKNGNHVPDKDGKDSILTDGTGFISEDLAIKCPKNVFKGSCKNADNVERYLVSNQIKEKFSETGPRATNQGEPPVLIQFRLFNKGSAAKGTLLVNKKLPPNTIEVRPSMIKVEIDPGLSCISSLNSLEIVTTSNRPKTAYLSKLLIALLYYGGIPGEFFLDLLHNALQDAKGALTNKRAALRVALNHSEMGGISIARMILAGIPLEESFLQHHLSILKRNEQKSLRGGKIPVPESYYLMGTADPTGILEEDEVCIILDNGHISGKVLVYRNPGLHFGDIHILKAKYVKEMEDFVGNSKYAIFFSCKGSRSVADEIAGGDYDGDMYFVSRNPQLLEKFKQSEPWIDSLSSTNHATAKKPSEYSDKELEDELFKLFLQARFQPSYTAGLAASSCFAMMDRLITLGDNFVEEKRQMKINICKLIDIYYYALDAPKKGKNKIDIPDELEAELYPHYMEKREEISYRSSSILGQIYDTVMKAYEEDTLVTNDVWKLPCFCDPAPPDWLLDKWQQLYCEYRQEMTNALRCTMKDEACDEVLKKYKKILYDAAEFEESKKEQQDIFNESRAIYNVVYDYARKMGDISKCGFVWRVAGSPLCQIYIEAQNDRTMTCSVSALKEILG